jgi:hypothetical protein
MMLISGPCQRVDWSYAGWRGLLRSCLPNPVQIFVTHRNDAIVVPGIDISIAPRRLQEQSPRQTERHQKVSYFFQNVPLLHQLVQFVMNRRFWRCILDIDAIRLQRGCIRRNGYQERQDCRAE